MGNNVLQFARWVDDFEQRNPERKFASVEEALQYYRAYEGRDVGRYESEVEKFVATIPENSNGKHAVLNDELSLEIISRAMKEEGGEYFYLVYAPGPDGSNLMDMSIKNGSRLVEILASYALQQNAAPQVEQFTRMVSRILLIATSHIQKENARRAQNN